MHQEDSPLPEVPAPGPASAQEAKKDLLSRVAAALAAAPGVLVMAAQGQQDIRALREASQARNGTELLRLAREYTSARPELVVAAIEDASSSELLEVLTSDICAAILSRHADHVEFRPLDGGCFRILNDRDHLRRFLDRLKDRFTLPNPVRRLRFRTTASELRRRPRRDYTPAVIAELSCSKDPAFCAGAYLHPVQDGPFVVATDKQRLTLIVGSGASPIESVDGFGRGWRAFVQQCVILTDSGFSISPASLAVATAVRTHIVGAFFRATAVFDELDRAVVDLHWKNGTVHVTAVNVNEQTAAGVECVEEGATPTARVPAAYLFDALQTGTFLGCLTLGLAAVNTAAGVAVVVAHEGRGFTIIMPARPGSAAKS